MAEALFDTAPFAAQLERAGAEVLQRVQQIANDAARGLAHDIVQAYPMVTGDLRAHVSWNQNTPGRGLGAWVRSTARHVHLVESGKPGPGRGNTRETPLPKGTSVYFIPRAIQARERFHRAVEAVMRADRRVG